MKFQIVAILLLTFAMGQKTVASSSLEIGCTHVQVCNSLKFLLSDNKNILVKKIINLQGEDPHHFEPKVGDVKKLIKQSFLVLAPSSLQPWLKSIRQKRLSLIEKNNKLVTIQPETDSEHFWLDERDLCNYLFKLDQSLGLKIPTYIKAKEKIDEQCLKRNNIEKDMSQKKTIIILHNSLTTYLSKLGHNVISLREKGHHKQITSHSFKKLKTVLRKENLIYWIIEKQIHYPTNLKNLIKSHHKVIEIDTLGKDDQSPWFILDSINQKLKS